jgi:hypothetical protein
MWLDVQVTDASGREIHRSGNLDAKGDIVNDPRIFNAHALDKDGKDTVRPWEMAKFKYNKTIPPKGSATENFFFLVPPGALGSLKAQVTLRYRSYPQALANMLLGEKSFELPVCDMAATTATIAIVN